MADCLTRNQTVDPKEFKFTTIEVNEANRQAETTPTVIQVNGERYIQCAFKTLGIEGHTTNYDRKPFAIPIELTFNIDGFTHDLEIVETGINIALEDRLLAKEDLQKSFLDAMNLAAEHLRNATTHNNELKEMNLKNKIEQLIIDNPVVAGIGVSGCILAWLIIGIIIYSICRKDPIVAMAEIAFLSNTMNTLRNSQSLPNLTLTNHDQSIESANLKRNNTCMNIHFETLNPEFKREYPNLSFDNLYPPPPEE